MKEEENIPTSNEGRTNVGLIPRNLMQLQLVLVQKFFYIKKMLVPGW